WPVIHRFVRYRTHALTASVQKSAPHLSLLDLLVAADVRIAAHDNVPPFRLGNRVCAVAERLRGGEAAAANGRSRILVCYSDFRYSVSSTFSWSLSPSLKW